jgi:hypothetical protein
MLLSRVRMLLACAEILLGCLLSGCCWNAAGMCWSAAGMCCVRCYINAAESLQIIRQRRYVFSGFEFGGLGFRVYGLGFSFVCRNLVI